MTTHTETEFKLRALRAIEVASVDEALRDAGLGCNAADPGRHVDTYFDDEAGFFLHFPDEGFGQRLAQFDDTARQAPAPFERFLSALDEQDTAVVVEHHRANADDWMLRKRAGH